MAIIPEPSLPAIPYSIEIRLFPFFYSPSSVHFSAESNPKQTFSNYQSLSPTAHTRTHNLQLLHEILDTPDKAHSLIPIPTAHLQPCSTIKQDNLILHRPTQQPKRKIRHTHASRESRSSTQGRKEGRTDDSCRERARPAVVGVGSDWRRRMQGSSPAARASLARAPPLLLRRRTAERQSRAGCRALDTLRVLLV